MLISTIAETFLTIKTFNFLYKRRAKKHERQLAYERHTAQTLLEIPILQARIEHLKHMINLAEELIADEKEKRRLNTERGPQKEGL